jgi:hypothetical protein
MASGFKIRTVTCLGWRDWCEVTIFIALFLGWVGIANAIDAQGLVSPVALDQ